MKKQTVIAIPALMMALFLATTPAHAQEPDAEKTYVRAVMTILRSHIEALKYLTAVNIKYSDNVVLHAIAVRRTVGFLDHGEWQSAAGADGANPKLDAKTFERLAKNGRKASRKMETAARQWLKDGNRRTFLTAMNGMTTTCNNCHNHLAGAPAPIFALIDLETDVSSRQDAVQ